ncbi:MAG TPA: hypothetical protein VJU82_10235, partial [Acidobacteriaceae bacterium]|nr:hypothetical protein [Acidobacteriaceae bacterium]
LSGNVFSCTMIVVVLLFVHGYYITTALFGVFWRSSTRWVYPTLTMLFFILHTHIVFLRGKPDLTAGARAMELPFIVGGAFAVFVCSFVGNQALSRWCSVERSSSPYFSATVLTALFYVLLSTADYLRPVVGSSGFRPYGVPFTFYREGGFIREWVWRDGVLIWTGLIGDLAVVAVVAALAGEVTRRIHIFQRSKA